MIRRFAPVALLALASWGLVATLAWRTLAAEAREAERARDDLFRDAARRIELAVERNFRAFADEEARRPFYHYQFFYVPETVAGGAGLSRSPLGDAFGNAYGRNYFQIDDTGRLSTPYWNRDVPDANGSLPDPERRIEIQRELSALLEPVLRPKLLEGPDAAPQTVGKGQVLKQGYANVNSNLDNEAQQAFFGENRANPQGLPQGTLQVVRGGQAGPGSAQAGAGAVAPPPLPCDASPPAAPEAVEVRYSPFASLAIGGRVLLVRRVEAGEKKLVQGFELDRDAAAARAAEIAEPLLLADMVLSYLPGAVDPPQLARGAVSVDLGGWRYRAALVDLAPGVASAGMARRRALALAGVSALGLLMALALAALWRFIAERVALARERTAFATAVSHELRTPLTSLKLHAEMLEKGWVKGDPQEYARRIRTEAERLSRLVQNVLGAARLERGEEVAVAPRPTDPREPARRAHALFAPSFADRGGLALEVQEPLPGEVPLDADAIAQVLANLLDNALKHGRGATRLRIRGAGDGASAAVRYEVEDEGPGLPTEEQGSFEGRPFAPSAARDAKGGLGLGLAIVRRIAEAHGGRATCARGCFAVELPAAPR